MPRRRREKPPAPPALGGSDGTEAVEGGGRVGPSRPGLPAPESVIGESDFRSPSGTRYRIIHTTEADPKDEESPPKRRRGRRVE